MKSDHDHSKRLVFVCSHVAEQNQPVRAVFREHDGDWQFMCGGTDHTDIGTARFACWQCMLEQDRSLSSVITRMTPGTMATRTKRFWQPWKISLLDAAVE